MVEGMGEAVTRVWAVHLCKLMNACGNLLVPICCATPHFSDFGGCCRCYTNFGFLPPLLLLIPSSAITHRLQPPSLAQKADVSSFRRQRQTASTCLPERQQSIRAPPSAPLLATSSAPPTTLLPPQAPSALPPHHRSHHHYHHYSFLRLTERMRL